MHNIARCGFSCLHSLWTRAFSVSNSLMLYRHSYLKKENLKQTITYATQTMSTDIMVLEKLTQIYFVSAMFYYVAFPIICKITL